MKKKHLVWLILIWTSIIATSFGWNYLLLLSNNQKVVLNKSQAFFEQILVTRAWNAQHGGVYVPVTETTPPNPYLKDPLRDVVTVDGLQLTKLNPSYMTRQISEIDKNNYDLHFHITSLNPIRPENKADEWETTALTLFEKETPEILEVVKTESSSQYRYMAPLITEKSCLKCHEKQGYKLGDVRGGISISFSSDMYLKGMEKQIFALSAIHLLILGLGIMGIFYYRKKTNTYFSIIKNKNTELMQTNATKDKFFSIIAHDLRNPFNIILGYTDLLKSGYHDLKDDDREEIIGEIDKSSNRAFELLENLLLWARVQKDRLEIVKVDLNVKEIINGATEAYLSGAEKKNLTVDFGIPENIIIHADKFTISTVIVNLFSNAIKFTPENGNIDISATDKDHFIEISISDNGMGIPPENISKLFRVEYNLSTLGTNDEKGTGLGLILCKEFVEKNGGTIRVESEVGKGTNFIITIPKRNDL
ncbi:MAG: DUF3365 domain-containing protein [Candidatus Marinimicrobia bacterium]|nr:DUF3365 domain-containing protein [Candidatus Neomarinimicrobiota bacterium]